MEQKFSNPPVGMHFIFRKTIRLKNGRILCAAQYGLEAFPLLVKD